MIDADVRIDLRPARSAIELLARATRRDLPEVLRTEAALVLRNVIAITPPASGRADLAAKRRGEKAIARDLGAIFVRVPIRGRDDNPDVAGIHQRHFARKTPGRRIRRDRAQPYYADRTKVQSLEMELRAQVGRLAAGWLPAIDALRGRSRIPQWIARHGARAGRAQVRLTGNHIFVRATNDAPGVTQDMHSRVQRAVDQQTLNIVRKVERALTHRLR